MNAAETERARRIAEIAAAANEGEDGADKFFGVLAFSSREMADERTATIAIAQDVFRYMLANCMFSEVEYEYFVPSIEEFL